MSLHADVSAGAIAAAADTVAERLAVVRERARAAAARAGRDPVGVGVVAVSKGFPADRIAAARAAGHVDFGESRAQELRAKSAATAGGVRWHFVGRLQRNKVRDVVGVATLVHSVDRLELAVALGDEARRRGVVQRVLVQVNIGDDPAKGGCAPEEALALVARVRDVDGVACEGLMTVPPRIDDPRAVFAGLRQLRDTVRRQFPEVRQLSMGMSGDYEIAVEEGATLVRVGEAVFGQRPAPA